MTALHGGGAGDLVLIIAVGVLVVGFLLVYLWTRRPSGGDAVAAPTMDRPPEEVPAPMRPEPFGTPEPFRFPEQIPPDPPGWAAEPPGVPLERRRPLPPDAAFSLTEPSSE